MEAAHSIGAEFRIRYDTRAASFVLYSIDPRFGDVLRLYVSSKPKSANYNPSVFNRLARTMRDAGRRAPAQDIPENDRRLARRS